MIGTLSHRLLQLVAAIAAVLTVVVALLAWRVASGPVALDWLTPYIAAALSTDDGRVTTAIGGTQLRLSDDVKLIELVAVDVRATGRDGELLAELPEIEVGLSLRALLRGVIAVARLDAIAPRLVLLRKEDGSIGLRGRDDAGAGQIELGLLIEKVLNPPDPSDPASYLERFEIAGGRLTLIDEGSGQQIEAQDADLVLLRHPDGLGGNLAFELVQAGAPASVRLSGRYQTASEWIRLGLGFEGLVPADLASLAPALPLAGVGLPLSGRLEGGIKLDGERAPVDFELAAGPGLLDLPDLLTAPLTVDGIQAAGELASDLESVALRSFEAGSMGATLTGTAELSWHERQIAGTIGLNAKNVAVENLDLFWPPEAGDAARAWVIPHIVAGIVPEARATITIQPGDLAQRPVPDGMVEGSFAFENLTVRYFEDLPPLTDVSGRATFSAQRMDFAIDRGRVGDIAASDGSVVITGIGIPGREATQLAIGVQVVGGVRDVLALIDHPPLGFAGKAGLSPADASGRSSTDLRVGLPLHREVSEEEVWVNARSVLSDAGIRTPDVTLQGGNLDLSVDNDGFDLAGEAQVEGVPLQLEVRDNFADDAPFSNRVHARGLVAAAEITRRAGDLPLDLSGAVGLEATITETPGVRRVEIALDLEPLAIATPLIADWRKAAGEPGGLSASLVMADDAPIEIQAFALTAPELEASGSLRLRPDPLTLQSMVLERLRLAATEGALRVSRGIDQGYDVNLTAASLDLDPLIGALERDHGAEQASDEPPAPLRLTLRAERVMLSGRTLRDVAADLQRDPEGWRSALIRAQLPKGSQLTLTLAPDGDDRRLLVTSKDAGDLFETIDKTSRIAGGELNLDAQVKQQYPTLDVEGTVRITDFTLLEAPILARLLTVASLTGIGNLLSGEGIFFDRFDMPFRYTGDILSVDRVRLSGSQLGLTAKGKLDLAGEQIDLSGTVVPVYGLNWAIGRIPILGDFLRGAEGDGAFAMTYSVSGATGDPSILVNPLSVLAPGVIRDLFSGIFEGSAEEPAVRGTD